MCPSVATSRGQDTLTARHSHDSRSAAVLLKQRHVGTVTSLRRPVQDQALIFQLTNHHPGQRPGAGAAGGDLSDRQQVVAEAAMARYLTVSLRVCSPIAVAEAVAGQPLSGRRGSSQRCLA
jgi:hypothetical protein